MRARLRVVVSIVGTFCLVFIAVGAYVQLSSAADDLVDCARVAGETARRLHNLDAATNKLLVTEQSLNDELWSWRDARLRVQEALERLSVHPGIRILGNGAEKTVYKVVDGWSSLPLDLLDTRVEEIVATGEPVIVAGVDRILVQLESRGIRGTPLRRQIRAVQQYAERVHTAVHTSFAPHLGDLSRLIYERHDRMEATAMRAFSVLIALAVLAAIPGLLPAFGRELPESTAEEGPDGAAGDDGPSDGTADAQPGESQPPRRKPPREPQSGRESLAPRPDPQPAARAPHPARQFHLPTPWEPPAERDAALLRRVREEIGRVIVGQEGLIDRLMLALLCNAHVLVQGVPGLAKTLSVTTLARTIRCSFRRIQFTPDLLPADLTGTLIYNEQTHEFTPHRGPVFANIVLADEINRAPAKVQSALLEAMQERQVTIGDESHRLDDPFMVLATENPIEQEGTYPLPEAQTDRFMLKLRVPYPSVEEEREILHRMAKNAVDLAVEPVISPEEVRTLRAHVDAVYLDEKIVDYIISVVTATRDPAAWRIPLAPAVRYGASPRASIYLTLAAKAHALLHGRLYVTPADVKALAADVLRHRVITSYEGEAEGITSEDLIRAVLGTIPVP